MTDQIGFSLFTKMRQENDMTDSIDLVYFEIKTELTNYRSTVYAKNEIELPWPIKWGIVYNENHTGQWPNQS